MHGTVQFSRCAIFTLCKLHTQNPPQDHAMRDTVHVIRGGRHPIRIRRTTELSALSAGGSQ